MSLELSSQDWSFIEDFFAEPDIPVEDGADQSIQNHLVQSGQDWSFYIDAETNQWVRMFGERFIELDVRKGIKMPSRSETIQGSHKKSVTLKVRKKG